MFEYLVTSRTRRTLLKLLCGDGCVGTAADFARWARVAFAGAHKELHAMENAGLVECRWEKGHKVFGCVKNHPMKRVLEALVHSEQMVFSSRTETDDSPVKGELAYLGLPVNTQKRLPKQGESLESLLAAACKLAREDSSVARSLPVVLSRYRNELDFELLRTECKRLGQKHAMGFFLHLAGELSNDLDLARKAERFRDRRRTKNTHFFNNPSVLSRRVAEERTPQLAKSWAWLMNMSMDSFRSTFEKFDDSTSFAR